MKCPHRTIEVTEKLYTSETTVKRTDFPDCLEHECMAFKSGSVNGFVKHWCSMLKDANS